MATNHPWYRGGLRFCCTGCGQCCTGSPGYVWLTEEDVREMAAHLGISCEVFVHRYTRNVSGRLALLEDRESYDCIFLVGKRCSVYEARPQQCRKFPWWPEHLTDRQQWKKVAARCEGIDHPDAPLVSLEEIQQQLGP